MDPVSSGLDPTVPLEAYNNGTSTGGDSRLYNLNVFYNVSLGIVGV
jgi:Amt family ammonium transporter